MNYNEVENTTNYTGKALYNGNIAETYWRTNNDDVKRKYGYFYDDLNRLTSAVYQKPNLAVPVTNSYNESLSYDKNGNIISLVRNGEFDDANYALEIDNLTYTYDLNKRNQLMNLVDGSNNPNGFKDDTNPHEDYVYDSNGNMVRDANKGIDEIVYNHLNLPTKITFVNQSRIEYLYNATGQKIKKMVYPQTGSVVETEYLDGFQYNKASDTNAVVLDFFPHAEGYVKVSGESTDYDYSYVYNYLDRLGNVRLSYGTEPNGDVVKILEENNYYPFGMKHNNYNVDKKQYEKYGSELSIENCTNCSYKYKYNGKEYQDELGLNMYDYGARNYDPALGRWMNIDPLAEKFHNFSPYVYALNNPVMFIDPDGMAPKPPKLSGITNISNVLSGKKWISYGSNITVTSKRSIFGYELSRSTEIRSSRNGTYECADYSRLQVKQGGGDYTAVGAKNRVDMYLNSRTTDKSRYDLQKGVDTIIENLKEGKAVMAGVMHSPNVTTQEEDHANKSSNHYVTIVGMGTDDEGAYFSYYDNFTGGEGEEVGTDVELNKFRLNKSSDGTYYFSDGKDGNIPYNGNNPATNGRPTRYVLTEIRDNE